MAYIEWNSWKEEIWIVTTSDVKMQFYYAVAVKTNTSSGRLRSCIITTDIILN